MPRTPEELSAFKLPQSPDNLFPLYHKKRQLLHELNQILASPETGMADSDSLQKLLWLNSRLVGAQIGLTQVDAFSPVRTNKARLAEVSVIDEDDLLQVGLIGLWRALKCWDGQKSALSSYALQAVRVHMRNEVAENGNHLSITETRARTLESGRRFLATGAYIEYSPAAAGVSMSEELVGQSESFDALYGTVCLTHKSDLADDEIANNVMGEEIALTPNLSAREQTLPDDDLEETVTNKHLARWLINQLEPREQTVIKLRFGLDGESLSLSRVGQLVGGVTKQAIHETEVKALKKMHRLAVESSANV